MNKTLSLFLKIILIGFVTTSCKLSYRILLGVDISPEWKTEKDLVRDFKKNKIKDNQRFVLDTASYYTAIKKDFKTKLNKIDKDSTIKDSIEIKRVRHQYNNDLQPVQVRYFSNDGEPIFKMINCYVHILPIRWNVENCFDSFPPQSISDLEKDDNQNIRFFLPHITTLAGDSIAFKTLPKADYYAVVFWNYFMKRPSKKLLKQLKKYEKQFPDKEVYFLYVNNQNSEIWNNIEKPERDKIFSQLNDSENQ